MSKLIVISNPMHDFIDPNFLSQFVAELVPYTLKDAGYKIIGTDRYTLDHAREAEHRPENMQHD